jgi:poly(3-hydroxybutyrate) depolymerase
MKTLHILLMILFVAGTGAASGESTLTGGTVEDIFLTSSYDGKTVRSQIMIPDGYQEGSPAPLVLSLHGALCTAEDGIFFVRQACNDRGWFIAAPDTHGDHTSGEFSFAGLAAQHDCIDILESVSFPVQNSQKKRDVFVQVGILMDEVIQLAHQFR